MLTQPTLDKLNAMKLSAMAQAFADQMQSPDMAALTFEERFGLIIDFQMTAQENRRMQSRLKNARLRLSATIEDLEFTQGRGLDRATVMSLAQNQWVNRRHNILVTGPTGAGKTYLACAFGQKACRDGHSVLYHRAPRLLQDIMISRHDGRYSKVMGPLSKADVLVLDDFLISPMTQEEQKEFLEIVEERHDRKATVITSQLPLKAWYDAMQDPTLADAILDRLVHNAYKIELTGESMRRKKSRLDRQADPVAE